MEKQRKRMYYKRKDTKKGKKFQNKTGGLRNELSD